MNEAYVSFDTAKLLKEKGFDWKCNHYYMENISGDEHYLLPGSIMYGKDYNKRIKLNELGVNINTSSGKISVPTQQMVCRWLREEHKIDISVTPDDGSWWIKVTELESWSCVFDGKVLNSDDIKHAYKGNTNTKEECYEAALQYVLKNLI